MITMMCFNSRSYVLLFWFSLTHHFTRFVSTLTSNFHSIHLKKLQIAAVLLTCCYPLRSPAAIESLPNYDKCPGQAKADQPAVVNAAKENAASVIRNRIQDVRIDTDEILGSPKCFASTPEFLTGANGSGGAVFAATTPSANGMIW